MTPRVSREDVNPEVVKLLTEAIILSKPVWSSAPKLPYSEFNPEPPEVEDMRRGVHSDAISIDEDPRVEALTFEACKLLGADARSNAIVYPPNGIMDWHTNSNMPGQKLYYNFNLGRGYFYFKDTVTGEIVDDHDNIGWTARRFDIPDRPPFLWHAVTTFSLRFSFGFWFKQREGAS